MAKFAVLVRGTGEWVTESFNSREDAELRQEVLVEEYKAQGFTGKAGADDRLMLTKSSKVGQGVMLYHVIWIREEA